MTCDDNTDFEIIMDNWDLNQPELGYNGYILGI